ncbi:MAG: hypothetical protein FJ292_06620 [Planctomycetes bacterium]|nr:hypothetical protein [Planctomycetota bacterium]
MKQSLLLTCLTALLLAAGEPPAATPRVGYAWPLPTCVVSGEPLGAKSVVKVLEDPKDASVHGREVRFCCEKCVNTFEANRAKYLEAADALIVQREQAVYPSAVCIIMTDEKLAAPGTPEAADVRGVVVGNQLVRLCCASCERKVRRNPTSALAKVQRAAVEAQAKDYPLKACPISGRPLPAEPVDTLLAGRLVRLCCKECQAKAEQDVAATLAKLDAARATKPS